MQCIVSDRNENENGIGEPIHNWNPLLVREHQNLQRVTIFAIKMP